jgi:tetratricopeptide (TPR) repeat protein
MSASSSSPANRAKDTLARASGIYRKAEFSEAIRLARQALDEISALPEGDQRSILLDSAYRRIVESLDRSNEFDLALSEIEAWEQATSRREGRADALALRARLVARLGDYTRALFYISEGLTLAQNCGYAAGTAALLRFRADILWMRGEASEALTQAKQALAIYERLGDQESLARTLNTIANSYIALGQLYQAIPYALRSISILERLGDQVGLRIMYSNVGEVYQQLFAMKTALYYHEQALKMSGDRPSVDLLRNLGLDLVLMGRVDEGLGHLLQALQDARALGDKDATMQVLHSTAQAVFGLGQINEARALAIELLESARPLEAIRHIMRAALILGQCARAEGNLIAAEEFLLESFMAAQQATDKSMLWQIHFALYELLVDRQPILAKVHGTIARDMVNNILMSIEDAQLREVFRAAPLITRVLELDHAR